MREDIAEIQLAFMCKAMAPGNILWWDNTRDDAAPTVVVETLRMEPDLDGKFEPTPMVKTSRGDTCFSKPEAFANVEPESRFTCEQETAVIEAVKKFWLRLPDHLAVRVLLSLQCIRRG